MPVAKITMTAIPTTTRYTTNGRNECVRMNRSSNAIVRNPLTPAGDDAPEERAAEPGRDAIALREHSKPL